MPGALGKSEKPGWLEYPEPPEIHASINHLEVKKHLLKHFYVHINAFVVTKGPLQLDMTSTMAGIIRRAAAATLWHRLVG